MNGRNMILCGDVMITMAIADETRRRGMIDAFVDATVRNAVTNLRWMAARETSAEKRRKLETAAETTQTRGAMKYRAFINEYMIWLKGFVRFLDLVDPNRRLIGALHDRCELMRAGIY